MAAIRRFPATSFIDGGVSRGYSARSMTVEMTQDGAMAARNPRRLPGPRRILFARISIFIERLAPIIVAAGGPLALVAIASLFDVWAATPRWAHALALIVAFTLAAAFAFRMRRRAVWPPRAAGLARLERDGAVRHEALRALEDAPAAGASPLWEVHLAEMREKARAARLASPGMTANLVDPFGLRYAALALFLTGWIAAGYDAGGRLIAGFISGDPKAGAAGFADLWIEPPAYVGKAPIYLLRTDDSLPGLREQIDAPEGSIVHAQVNGRSRFRLTLKTEKRTVAGERAGPEKSARVTLLLKESGLLALRAGGRAGRWPIGVIDDRAPSPEFVEPLSVDKEGRLVFVLQIDDDYGAVSASLRLRLDASQKRPLDSPAFDAAAKEEKRLIPIDAVAGPPGRRSIALDLRSDPWAGLKVIADVIVADAAGQSGRTAPATIVLPAKQFFNPLAKAVIEQRQSLAVAANEWRRAEWALNGLTLGPEYFFDDPTDYLLMRTAMWRITKKAGGDFKETVEEFWPLALQLEDEALELARRRLEAAKEALKAALENDAPDADIERLTEEMRTALRRYLEALAQSGERMADGPPPNEIVSAADLDAMLDSIRDLAASGADNAARQALADLENLLSNLRRSGRGQGAQGEGGEGRGGGAAGEAGDLIGRQRELADESFAHGQIGGAEGDDLGREQGALARDLSALMDSLEDVPAQGRNADPDGAAARSFAQALADMRRSEGALNIEDFGDANEAMESAIANLREGAEALARAEGAAARAGRGEGAGPTRDPLGRPIGDAYGQGVEVPEKSDAQKTRELLLELRRRLSEGDRAEDEINYLERLLERF